MQTIKVLPWADGQGDFVEINAVDFDPAVHVRLAGDDTPLPGKYDHHSREQLLDLVLVEAKAELAKATDQELREILMAKERRDAILAAGEPEPDLFADAGSNPYTDGSLFGEHGSDSIVGGEGEDSVTATEVLSVEEVAARISGVTEVAPVEAVTPEAVAEVVSEAATELAAEPAAVVDEQTAPPTAPDADADGHDDKSGQFVDGNTEGRRSRRKPAAEASEG